MSRDSAKFSGQERKEEDLLQLRAKYQPLMESFLKLQSEALLMLNGKGDEHGFYKALIEFTELIKKDN